MWEIAFLAINIQVAFAVSASTTPESLVLAPNATIASNVPMPSTESLVLAPDATIASNVPTPRTGSLVLTPNATIASNVPTSSTGTPSTEKPAIWDEAVDIVTPMGTFILVLSLALLVLILLIALICVCSKYRNLKQKTSLPSRLQINDSDWIRSSDDLLMWERNLRASEVSNGNQQPKQANGKKN